MTMGRIFITGGTGYLGQALVRHAQAQGWLVAASYYSQLPALDSPVTWLPLDIRDADAVAEACAAIRPDVIVHTAFRQYEPDLRAVTAEGAHNVAQSAYENGARLIHMSSDVIFDGRRDFPYTEADPPNPINAYGAAKAEAEYLVATAHPAAVIVRTSLIYGFAPMDMHTRFVLDLIAGQRHARLFSDEFRCPIYVDDLAAALLELSRLDYQGVIHIAGAERVSRYEFGTLLAQAHGHDPTRLLSGLSAESLQPRPRDCTLDIRLAQSLLQTPLRGVRTVLTNHLAQNSS